MPGMKNQASSINDFDREMIYPFVCGWLVGGENIMI